MSEPTFQIGFRGKLLSGFDRAQVRANLAQLFKSDPARIDALLDAPKTVLKSGLNKDAASRYQEVLRQAGIMVALIGDPLAAVASAPVAEAPREPAVVTPRASEPEVRSEAPSAALSGMSLAAAGERIIPPSSTTVPNIDTSALSLAAVGVTLGDARTSKAPQFDFAGMSIASDTGPIDKTPKPPPARIDTSALTLTEVAPESLDKAPSELQKLLSTAVD